MHDGRFILPSNETNLDMSEANSRPVGQCSIYDHRSTGGQ